MNLRIRKELPTPTILNGFISSTKNHTDYHKLKPVMVEVGTNMYERAKQIKVAIKDNVTITLTY